MCDVERRCCLDEMTATDMKWNWWHEMKWHSDTRQRAAFWHSAVKVAASGKKVSRFIYWVPPGATLYFVSYFAFQMRISLLSILSRRYIALCVIKFPLQPITHMKGNKTMLSGKCTLVLLTAFMKVSTKRMKTHAEISARNNEIALYLAKRRHAGHHWTRVRLHHCTSLDQSSERWLEASRLAF